MPEKQTAHSPRSSVPMLSMDDGTALRFGSTGSRVSTLQLKLSALRYDVGTADGVFGKKTLDAVKAFQRAKGLTADGVVGAKTAGALGLPRSAPGGGTSHAPQHTADSPASGSKKPTQGGAPLSVTVKNKARVLVEQFASEWSTDEEGLAQALYLRGKDAPLVTAAFDLLEEEYGSDADDVAVAYVELVVARRGMPLELLKQDGTLRELLIHLLSSGSTFPDEERAIQFLRNLASTGAGSSSQVERMVQAALKQKGKSYVFGTEVAATETDAAAFDCSELVEWAVSQAGGYIPDGSQAQREWCRKHKTTLSVEEAIKTRGALLFTDTHVAISLGDGMTIEAANKKKGVCSLTAAGRGWKEAGLVPGLGKGASTEPVAEKSPSKTGTKTASGKSGAATTEDPSAGDVLHGHVIYPNEVRGQGSIAWRNNNPGNIRNGKFTNAHGAFKNKSNRGFAIFPSHAVGFAALLALLKTDSYRPLNVADAMKRYAPSEDSNDPVAYARTVSKMTGLDVGKTLGSLTDGELEKFAKAIQKVEGWVVGTSYPLNDARLAEMGISTGDGKKATQPTRNPGTQVSGTQSNGAKSHVVIVATPELGAVGKVARPLTGTASLPATAHQDSLKKLGQRARTRMNKKNEGYCARGVCEMLGEAGFLYGGERPRVSSGIIKEVYDYGTGRWISATTQGHYVSSHGCLDSNTQKVKKGLESKVRSASATDSAKFMRHTLKMFKFAECTAFLKGHGSRGKPPEASVAALRALPEGAVVVFGPAISRSVVKNSDNSYSVGGGGHAGHVGVLVREGEEVLVVADGLLAAGGKYTVELCLANYAWAVGFVPTTGPLKLTQKDRPSASL